MIILSLQFSNHSTTYTTKITFVLGENLSHQSKILDLLLDEERINLAHSNNYLRMLGQNQINDFQLKSHLLQQHCKNHSLFILNLPMTMIRFLLETGPLHQDIKHCLYIKGDFWWCRTFGPCRPILRNYMWNWSIN